MGAETSTLLEAHGGISRARTPEEFKLGPRRRTMLHGPDKLLLRDLRQIDAKVVKLNADPLILGGKTWGPRLGAKVYSWR